MNVFCVHGLYFKPLFKPHSKCICSDIKLFNEDGSPIGVTNRGGVCWLCGEKAICGDCSQNTQPNSVVEQFRESTNAENDSNDDWLKAYELWTCPGCLFDYPQIIHISDQLALHSEKRSSKYFPLKITHEFNVRGDCFLSQAEIFGLLCRFGGSLNVCLRRSFWVCN